MYIYTITRRIYHCTGISGIYLYIYIYVYTDTEYMLRLNRLRQRLSVMLLCVLYYYNGSAGARCLDRQLSNARAANNSSLIGTLMHTHTYLFIVYVYTACNRRSKCYPCTILCVGIGKDIIDCDGRLLHIVSGHAVLR